MLISLVEHNKNVEQLVLVVGNFGRYWIVISNLLHDLYNIIIIQFLFTFYKHFFLNSVWAFM